MFLKTGTKGTGELHTRMDLIMCSKFLSRPATDGTRQSNFAILDFTRKIALIGVPVILVK
jgi:phosphoenolpyruvate carboxykinase (ATP)